MCDAVLGSDILPFYQESRLNNLSCFISPPFAPLPQAVTLQGLSSRTHPCCVSTSFLTGTKLIVVLMALLLVSSFSLQPTLLLLLINLIRIKRTQYLWRPLTGRCATAPSGGDPCRSFLTDPFFCTLNASGHKLSPTSAKTFSSGCPQTPSFQRALGAHLHAHPSDLSGPQSRAPTSQSWKGPQTLLCANSPWGAPLSLVRSLCAHLLGMATHLKSGPLQSPKRTGLSEGPELLSLWPCASHSPWHMVATQKTTSGQS